MAQSKIDSIRKYLAEEFQGCEVEYVYNFDCISHVFSVLEGDTVYVMEIRRRELDDLHDVYGFFQSCEVGNFVRNNRDRRVLITMTGPQVE